MGENPFAEPGDPDRTVIRPMPGGQRAGRPNLPPPPPPSLASAGRAPARPAPDGHAAPASAQVSATTAGPEFDAFTAGDGPLAIAAAPLLLLLGRLSTAAHPPDPGDIRDRTRRELRAFERRAKAGGVPQDQMRLAHYAMCAALDDVVLNTPWGNQGRWQQQPLAVELHDDPQAGRGFFDQLRAQRDVLPDSRPVLEIMMICLSLGMMGHYRAAPDGTAQIERVRHHVFEIVSGAAPATPAMLAPDATGVRLPPPPRGGIPVWVGACAALAIATGAYVWALTSLNTASDDVYRAALATAPSAMPELVRPPRTPPPPPPPVPPPGPAERLRASLAGTAEVEVVITQAATILRVPAQALFPQPNATLASNPLLEKIAGALRDQTGPIRVLVYTDNQPSRTVGFPSNFALSAARAKAVRAALAKTVPDPARIAADGRADADPIAPNATPEGRERNRRIDIVLASAP